MADKFFPAAEVQIRTGYRYILVRAQRVSTFAMAYKTVRCDDLFEQGKKNMGDVERAYEMYSMSDLMEKAKEMYSFVSTKDK